MNTNVHQAVPFFWVHDIKASVRFYIDGLGFIMKQQWEHEGRLRWCRIEIGSAALMLQEFWTDGEDRNLPNGETGAGVSIWFQCVDALSLYREFRSRGIEIDSPRVGNGMWVVSVTDPDGYQLFFASPTDAPEESEYTEGQS